RTYVRLYSTTAIGSTPASRTRTAGRRWEGGPAGAEQRRMRAGGRGAAPDGRRRARTFREVATKGRVGRGEEGQGGRRRRRVPPGRGGPGRDRAGAGPRAE